VFDATISHDSREENEMPGAGDAGNVGPNLTTLASLRTRSKGVKLSYNTQTGRFSVQGVGFKQSVVRTLTGESVLDEARFREPLKELFEAAAQLMVFDGAIEDLFDQARDGLLALRDTYSGDEEKRSVVNLVIEEIARWTEREYDCATDLRDRYKEYLRYGISQDIAIVRSNPGVCYGWVCDWARRILTLQRFSYASMKSGAMVVPSVRPSVAEQARMIRKVDRRIQPLHEQLNAVQDHMYYTQRKDITQAQAFNMLFDKDAGFYNEKFRKFQDLFIEECVENTGIKQSDIGTDVFRRIFRKASAYGDGDWVFKVGLRRSDGGGHAIGIDLFEGKLQFFDPNVGDFWFPRGAERDSDDFLDDWWRLFCTTKERGVRKQNYQWWNLERLAKWKIIC
jgi:hypothetical protein